MTQKRPKMLRKCVFCVFSGEGQNGPEMLQKCSGDHFNDAASWSLRFVGGRVWCALGPWNIVRVSCLVPPRTSRVPHISSTIMSEATPLHACPPMAHSGPKLGLIIAHGAQAWAPDGPPSLEPSLGPIWAMMGPSLGPSWAIIGPNLGPHKP